MVMNLVSVNAGLPREVEWHGRRVRTSIWKTPAPGRVRVNRLNLDGDQQSDLSVHGGPEKAVYAYPSEHYEYWRRELPGMDLSWGAFGENFTTEGLLEGDVRIGDRLRAGSAEFLQPRMPCYKLGVRFARDDMVKRFLTMYDRRREARVREGHPDLLRLGSTLLALGTVGMMAAPITIARAIPDLTTRTSRHVLAGVLGLTAVAILECVLALLPIRRGERWALLAAAVPFVVLGIPIFVVDATYVARERLWNTLAPQGLGLLVGTTALTLCAFGMKAGEAQGGMGVRTSPKPTGDGRRTEDGS